MNVVKTFASRQAERPDAPTRTDAPTRRRAVDSRAVDRRADEAREVPEKRAPTRAEFSALLALIAGAGTEVREELLRQAPADGVALLDKLLDDPAAGMNALGLSESADHSAADALRYGMLTESGVDGATGVKTAAHVERQAALRALATGDDDLPMLTALRERGDHARLNEVIGRIVGGRAMTVDQLKARGDERAAELRATLDALLSHAGTRTGLELAALNAPTAADANHSGAEQAAITAAAAALASATAASAADVTTPIRDTDALAPALREKLDRVVDRMKREYGHDVTVVETARSQERQDHLYEQGRTRPGAVVTWTRDSAHLHGDAVDVIIDGAWDNAQGFARLQRIAREEGLKTLGVRDPGHLELPPEQQRSVSAIAKADARSLQATPLIANGASQSGVARVAGVAGSAAVASVARVGDTGGVRSFERYTPTASTSGLSAAAAASAAIAGAQSSNGAREQGSNAGDAEQRAGRSSHEAIAPIQSESLGESSPNAFGAMHTHTQISSPGKSDATAPMAGAQAAERAADLQQLRDNAPAGEVSRLTMKVDGVDGAEDQITVDLRGSRVGTQISTDAASADRMRLRTAELQDALGRHGLESDSVRISGSARSEAADAARAITERDGVRLHTATPTTGGDGTNNQGQRERSANAREWDRPDPSRQSRDAERESAGQGAGQRGQRGTYNGSQS